MQHQHGQINQRLECPLTCAASFLGGCEGVLQTKSSQEREEARSHRVMTHKSISNFISEEIQGLTTAVSSILQVALLHKGEC